MNANDFRNLQVGDRIEFRAVTRNNARKAIRKITGFPTNYDYDKVIDGKFPRSSTFVLVRFEGSGNFYVRRTEIIRVACPDEIDRRQREQIVANQQRDQGVALARWRSGMRRGGA
jgi:hypothetical protein